MSTSRTIAVLLLLTLPGWVWAQNFNQLGADIDAEAAGDSSGGAVSLSADGSRLAIGAAFNNGVANNAGHVRIYAFNGMGWDQLGSDIDGENGGDLSGGAVSLSADGSRVAIGASGNDGTGNGAGHVRVYTFDGISWNQLGADIDGEAPGDFSGGSVSLSADGSRVAIGAPLNDSAAMNAGQLRIYEFDGMSWIQLGSDIDGEAEGDSFGGSVSLAADGSRVAAGAVSNDGAADGAGHVRVYAFDGLTWNLLGADIDGRAEGDSSGHSVSLSADGAVVAIGAIFNDGAGVNAGHVRVFAFDGLNWNQMGSDIDGEAPVDQSGGSVSLSSDGALVAIGARLADGIADNSGHVRLYGFRGGSWNQLGADIDGEAADDQSGSAVSLSGDGSRVAIGAPGNDGSGDFAGHVRVFGLPRPILVPSPANLDAGDRFGNAVATDGNLFAVGQPNADGATVDSGRVVIYRTEGTQLIEEFVIEVPPGMTATNFGAALALGGGQLLVGAPGTQASQAKGGLAALQAALFERLDSGLWQMKQTLSPMTGNDGDQFGASVALAGELLMVGAPGDAEEGVDSGAAYVFEVDGGSLVGVDKLKPVNGNSGAGFGSAVAIGINQFAVGSPGGKPPGSPLTTGLLHLFDQVNNNLIPREPVTGTNSADGDQFGASVALNGTTIVVGSPGEDGTGTDQGAVYLFAPSNLVQLGHLVPQTPLDNADFGSAVGLNNATIAGGAPGFDGGSGAVFQFNSGNFLQSNASFAENGQQEFGASIGLSRDSLVVGAPGTSSSAGAAVLLRDPMLFFRSGFE